MSDINATLLLEVALDLANSLTSQHRFDRLLSSVRKAITCDAVVILSLQGETLKPLAAQGLAPDALGRRFALKEHPRLAAICQSTVPLRFSEDSALPDPYDGLLLAKSGHLPVHACMGLPLYSDQSLIGVLTLDSLTPNIFSTIPERSLQLISALAAATLKTALQLKNLEHHARQRQHVLQELTHQALTRDGGELIGQSQVMQTLKNEIQLVAGSDYSVLIEGPTGVGKELVVRTIHQQSTRHTQPLVYINCASLPETLAESELFGHSRGAFTGAERDRPGKFQLADGGTLFLDEVGELPFSVQSTLLRALQSGEIQPVGRDHVSSVDVRIIAATNRDLTAEVAAGRFRADLYHRLAVYPIQVPLLKDRGSDVLLLAGFFLERTSRKLRLRQLTLSQNAQAHLLQYNWPGNVRELEHVLSRAALKASQTTAHSDIITIDVAHLELQTSGDVSSLPAAKIPSAKIESLKTATEDFQRQLILSALQVSQDSWTVAARLLQVDRANLARQAKRLGIRLEKSARTEY
ncbi:nitric oxide reductase transcriptional regulator NorR [Arsukibacterium indicum]|uniref:Nitric oxide reductase transcriptional regulator NorR n=1 Tax=Arsukibacterium indicum TaxID=2848612 RepID=A0ABS6MGV1_9GAMM|nr:nitric oxide reductase transcriptional regulator NorR [Arsukibacterium indicum]MBV2127594.1 nitric oxide reductase transcriptional regulator NorR [Arsukibacterium indicum]